MKEEELEEFYNGNERLAKGPIIEVPESPHKRLCSRERAGLAESCSASAGSKHWKDEVLSQLHKKMSEDFHDQVIGVGDGVEQDDAFSQMESPA